MPGVDFSAAWLRSQLAAPIDGGRHGRRSAKVVPGQLSLFDGLDAQTGHVQPKAPAPAVLPPRAPALSRTSAAAPALPFANLQPALEALF